MSSPEYCIQKAEMCEAQAEKCVGTSFVTQWLEMAGYWRELAGDKSDQATTARMVGNANRATCID